MYLLAVTYRHTHVKWLSPPPPHDVRVHTLNTWVPGGGEQYVSRSSCLNPVFVITPYRKKQRPKLPLEIIDICWIIWNVVRGNQRIQPPDYSLIQCELSEPLQELYHNLDFKYLNWKLVFIKPDLTSLNLFLFLSNQTLNLYLPSTYFWWGGERSMSELSSNFISLQMTKIINIIVYSKCDFIALKISYKYIYMFPASTIK